MPKALLLNEALPEGDGACRIFGSVGDISFHILYTPALIQGGGTVGSLLTVSLRKVITWL